jgi:hypothetical protein
MSIKVSNQKVRIIDVSVAMTSGASYVTGDFIGLDGVPLEFAGAGANVGQGGAIIGAVFTNEVAESIACELWLYDTAVTPPADSAAWTLSDAHAKRAICVIPVTTWYLSGANAQANASPDSYSAYKCLAGSTSIYGCLVARGTFTSPVITIRLSVLQN